MTPAFTMNVEESYDSAATAYAEHLFPELDQKPLDRHLLNRFAETVRGKGLVADLGCGPGHIAKYLHEQDVQVVGIDISSEMIRIASRLSPGMEFRAGDIRALDLGDGSLAGIIAFYSIVHFTATDLEHVAREWRRVLTTGGLALIAFHIGDESVHVDDLFGQPVSLDFQFHHPASVIAILHGAGIKPIESTEREPYADVEYPSRRCYLLATAS